MSDKVNNAQERKPLRKLKNGDLRFEIPNEEVTYGDQDTGWAWVVLFASFMTYCLLGSALYAVGIIHATLLERYGASISITAWAGALHTALISLAAPLSSIISDRFSCRVAIVTAGIMYAFGYGLTALASNILVAIFTCGLISGTAGGIAFTANMAVITYYFKKRRNLALGISVSGVGMGLFFLAPLMQWTKDQFGASGFFVLLAGLFLHMTVFGCLCFPSKLELTSKLKRALHIKKTATKCQCSILCQYIKVTCNKGILCYCLTMFNMCLAIYLLYLYCTVFIVLKGFTPVEAAFFVSLSGIFNVAGRIICGAIANFNSVNDIMLYSGSIATVATISFVYPFVAGHYAGQVAFFVVLGLFMGPCFVLTTSVSLKFVPIEDVAKAIGMEFAFGGVGAILGPVIAGFLIDQGGTYEQTILVAASFALFGAIFGFTTLCFQQRSICDKVIEVTVVETLTAESGRETSA